MRYIGIDPGVGSKARYSKRTDKWKFDKQRGAIALFEDDELILTMLLPVLVPNKFDGLTFYKIVKDWNLDFAFIESARKSGSGQSNQNYGALIQTFIILDVPFKEFHPATWQKSYKVGKKYEKQHGIDWCLSMGYTVPMTSTNTNAVYQHGISDAICVARYGYKQNV